MSWLGTAARIATQAAPHVQRIAEAAQRARQAAAVAARAAREEWRRTAHQAARRPPRRER